MKLRETKDNDSPDTKVFFQQQTQILENRCPKHKIKWIYDESHGRWCLQVDRTNNFQGYVWPEDENREIREWCGFCGHHCKMEPHIIGPLNCVVAAVEEYVLCVFAG